MQVIIFRETQQKEKQVSGIDKTPDLEISKNFKMVSTTHKHLSYEAKHTSKQDHPGLYLRSFRGNS